MAEQLNVPATGPQTTLWRVWETTFRRGLQSAAGPIVNDTAYAFISVRFIGQNGLEAACEWRGAAAETLLVALNKANNSIKSQEKRIIEQAVADYPAKFAGTVSGSPD